MNEPNDKGYSAFFSQINSQIDDFIGGLVPGGNHRPVANH
jgi:hypothetical protein